MLVLYILYVITKRKTIEKNKKNRLRNIKNVWKIFKINIDVEIERKIKKIRTHWYRIYSNNIYNIGNIGII